MTTDREYLTSGQIAKHFGVDLWQVLSLLNRKRIAEPKRHGTFRAFERAALPAIEKAMIEAGYLEQAPGKRKGKQLAATA